jgi:polyhydroxybutyrate depolymerase
MRLTSACLTASAVLLFSDLATAQLMNQTINVGGVQRQYVMYLPAGYDGSSPLPVMMAFHGGCDSAFSFVQLADFRPYADADQFMAVYPQGLPEAGDPSCPVWNSEGPFTSGVDDIGYTAAIIDDLAANYNIDETRVYACGYSNGANMSWELACLLSDRIAAVGPVAGSMWQWTPNQGTPTRPVPVVSIHGTQDFYNPWGGGPPYSLGLIAASEFFAQNANADTTPTIVDLPNIAPGDGSTVDLYTWGNGDDCVEVQHYRVQNGGHDWPGVFGNMDIDSTQVIWEFCKQFSLNGKIDCSDDPPTGCSVNVLGQGVGGANIGTLDLPTTPTLGSTLQFGFAGFNGASAGVLILSLANIETQLLGGTVFPDYTNPAATLVVSTDATGSGSLDIALGSNPILVGLTGYAQVGIADASQVAGWAFSNGLEVTFCN